MFVCLNCACVFSLMQGLMMYGKDITWSGPGLTCHKGFWNWTNAYKCNLWTLGIWPFVDIHIWCRCSPVNCRSALQGLEGNQLTASFSDDELKKAYRQAVRRSHPDAPGGACGPAGKTKWEWSADQLVSWEQDNETSRWNGWMPVLSCCFRNIISTKYHIHITGRCA